MGERSEDRPCGAEHVHLGHFNEAGEWCPGWPGERSEDLTPRPGGWVDGIGWVALDDAMRPDDEFLLFGLMPITARERKTPKVHPPVPAIVTRWADGEIPAAPAPPPERPQPDGLASLLAVIVGDMWDYPPDGAPTTAQYRLYLHERYGSEVAEAWSFIIDNDKGENDRWRLPAAALPVRERAGDRAALAEALAAFTDMRSVNDLNGSVDRLIEAATPFAADPEVAP